MSIFKKYPKKLFVMVSILLLLISAGVGSKVYANNTRDEKVRKNIRLATLDKRVDLNDKKYILEIAWTLPEGSILKNFGDYEFEENYDAFSLPYDWDGTFVYSKDEEAVHLSEDSGKDCKRNNKTEILD